MSENTTWVVAHDSSAALELIAGASGLGAPVSAVLLGDASASASDAVAAGAGTVLTAEAPSNGLLESLTPAVAAAFLAKGVGLVLVQASVPGRLIAGQLASTFSTSALNASELSTTDGCTTVSYLVYGGTAVCTRRIESAVGVVVVGPSVLPAPEAAPTAGSPGAVETLDTAVLQEAPAGQGLRVLASAPRQGETVNLAAASRVVGVGRGFGAEADLGLARDLAAALGAELACSRPITESENWMARERYIGVSGAVIKPELYFAVGISGQIQHMVGVSQARTIVAINKDKNAPVFKHADVGIVGDLYDLLPALTAALSA